MLRLPHLLGALALALPLAGCSALTEPNPIEIVKETPRPKAVVPAPEANPELARPSAAQAAAAARPAKAESGGG